MREAIEEVGALQDQRGWSGRSPGSLARVEFAEAQRDRARALGVLVELDHGHRGAAFVTDRDVLKALMEDAAPAFRDALAERAAAEKAERAERPRWRSRPTSTSPACSRCADVRIGRTMPTA